MAKLYNFARLIKKYSVNFVLVIPGEGKYIGGKYTEGEAEEMSMSGAIIPMSESKVYQSGGTYTSKDRQLYLLKPMEKALKGGKVKYDGNIYSIETETDYKDYCDAAVYNLKWVSSFDRA